MLSKKTLTWSAEEEEMFACFSSPVFIWLNQVGWLPPGCHLVAKSSLFDGTATELIVENSTGCSQGVASSGGSTFACFAQEQGLYAEENNHQ